MGSIRKAPQTTATGFRREVHKLTCIVQLLMGEIPERNVFRQTGLKKALRPYLELTMVSLSAISSSQSIFRLFGSGI